MAASSSRKSGVCSEFFGGAYGRWRAARKEEVMTLEQPAEIMLSLLQEKSSHIWRAVSLSSGAASGDKAQQHVGGQPGQVHGLGEAGDGIGTDLAA
jgi:hypothetical protein